jgi:hypothetical protein
MATFAGQRVTFSRFLGYMDEDDPTNLPSGVASLARNTDYTYTSARTRAGINKTMQALYQSPISGLMGLIYTPENDSEAGFQLPILSQLRGQAGRGTMQYESPVGSGRMLEFVYNSLFTPPQNAHMLGSQAYNRAYTSWSNLITPASRCSVLDLKTKNIDPYGQKPFGWAWIANTACLVGEMAGPSTIEDGVTVAAPNGHTYRCIVAGTTGAVQPAWPTTEGAVVVDGTVHWEELTMVLANRLPQPSMPNIVAVSPTGGFPPGLDVYLVMTLLNAQGETIASLPAKVTNTFNLESIHVQLPALADLPGWVQTLVYPYNVNGINLYEADVATGSDQPPLTEYQLLGGGPYAPGVTVFVNSSATSGIAPPTRNSARITPGMVPDPTTSPVVTRITAGGTFPVGRDVYVRMTYTNTNGETLPGPANSIINTQLNDAVQVLVEGLKGYTLAGVSLYEADVPTGANEPNAAEFALVGTYQPGQTATITATAFGNPPPTSNTTGTGGNIAADSDTGGPNDTQGYRYAVPAFKNRNGSISGITENAIVKYIVDENGWELAAFNVAVGPLNVEERIIGFSIADATEAGPFGFMAKSGIIGGIQVLKTVIEDNVTTSALVNFTDDQLDGAIAAGDSLTSYLDTIWPYPCVDLYYSPSLNRFFQTGVPGFASSHLVSQAGDAETYQGSTCEIKVGQDDGERCICVREFTNGTIFSLRERSGFILSPSSANPQDWKAQRQWSKVGPCGPRAVDVAGDFMIFIHRSGIYRYDQGEPELISKENPYWWKTINWDAQETIWCVIDVEKRVVRCGFPTGNSAVPNQEYAIHYVEGWAYPIHFSTYSGKMIAVDACRKVSINDVAAFCAARIERALPLPPYPAQGVDGLDTLGGDFYQSQFVYGSSAADGAVHAITPGTYNDNGAGIDWHYRTVSAGAMQTLSKCEGFNLNARGNGPINATFLSGRDMRTDWTPAPDTTRQVKARPFDLSPNQSAGISRMVESRVNEHWVLEFDNGKQPDVWAELKYLDSYLIPMYSGREAGER